MTCRTASRALTSSAATPASRSSWRTVVGFVEAPRLGLDLPLDVRGTAFQQRVWQALREIPAGETATYSRARAAHRRSRVREGGRRRVRGQSARRGDPLPSRGAQRRRALRLSLGRGAQARAHRTGGGRVNARDRRRAASLRRHCPGEADAARRGGGARGRGRLGADRAGSRCRWQRGHRASARARGMRSARCALPGPGSLSQPGGDGAARLRAR